MKTKKIYKQLIGSNFPERSGRQTPKNTFYGKTSDFPRKKYTSIRRRKIDGCLAAAQK